MKVNLDDFLPFIEGAELDAQTRLRAIEMLLRQQAEADRKAMAEAIAHAVTDGVTDAFDTSEIAT